MKSMNFMSVNWGHRPYRNPVRAWRLRAIAAWGGAATAIALSLAWAIRTPRIEIADPVVARSGDAESAAADGQSSNDAVASAFPIEAFGARLSPPPPPKPIEPVVAPPPAAVEAAPTAPASRLELLAIVRAGEALRASLYDPSKDRVIEAGAGEKIGSHEVRRVTERSVELFDGRAVRTLTLKEGPR